MSFPEGIPAVDSDGSGDFPVSDDMDIIHIMQERDAYKQETEKLRKIIERQRFIIKSLQDQLARKQSASANNTPSAPGSEFSMDPLEQPELDLPKPVVENTPVTDAVDRPANMASVALGLSSLSVSTPPKNGNAVRKVSQGSNATNLPQLPNGLAPIELTSVIPNIHPWTKSTRLSEIYADYSARHNSVSPMFKPSTGPWTQSGEEGQQHQQRVRSASGSSFTESLKNSIRRTEWPSEWGNQQEQGENSYGGERGADQQISSLVNDTSRGPSMTVSVDGDHRQETFIRTQPKHDSVFGTAVGNRDADYYAIRHVETADPEPASQPADATINEHDTKRVRSSVERVISSYSTKAPVVPLPAAPETNPTGQSYESADDEMFLRPASVAVHPNGAAVNGILAAAPTTSVGEPEDDDNAWLPTDYDGVNNSNDEHVGSSSQQQQQQLRRSEDAFVEKAPIILTSQQYQEHQQQSLPEEFAWLQNQSPQQPQSQSQSQLQSRQLDQQNQQPLVDRPASPSFGPNSSKGNSWDHDTPIATPLTAAQSIGTPVTHGTHHQPYNNQQAPPAEKQNSYDFQDASRLSTSQNSGIQSPFPFAVQNSSSRYENNSSPAILLAKSAQNMSDAIFRQPALSSLENIDIQIKDSRIKVDERGKEINVYMIDVVFRKEISGLSLQEMIVDSQQPLIVVWTVEKRYSDFLNLHTSLRQVIGQEKLDDKLERLPDKDIFRANAPTKSDKRKLWFEKYLKKALLLSIKDQSPLLQFLSTDRTMEPEKKMPILLGHKEGFLVKRGKNFGGWKRRYYVCKSNKPVLEYSDSPGGNINGTINLSGAIVKMGKSRSDDTVSLRGKGNNNKETDMFRHAFLILERPKREGKEPISHPLWAESDRERDEWVMALRYVIVREAEGPERAMKEVNRYVSYTKRKDSNVLMLQQIQTSLTHDHGARASIEQSRWKEDQRGAAAVGEDTNGYSSGAGYQNSSAASMNKVNSPLVKQRWPASTSLNSVDRANSFSMLTDAKRSQDVPAVNSFAATAGHPYQPRHNDEARNRTLSFPSIQEADIDLPLPPTLAVARPKTSSSSLARSPSAFTAPFSASFSGAQSESMSNQADRISHNYVPSDISTIESSIYSSYNGNEGMGRLNNISSQSIDDRNSYASITDSPHSNEKIVGQSSKPVLDSHAGAAELPLTNAHAGMQPPANAAPVAQFKDSPAAGTPYDEQVSRMLQPGLGSHKPQFTKNSIGRIVHEEEAIPELPTDTPRVTDDILGIGRQDTSIGDGKDNVGQGSNRNGRTREEKKRGRITFMWGKRKPAEADYPMPELASPSINPYGASSIAATPDTPPVPAPRRLRRGSTANETRNLLSRNQPFKGPVFGLPLERVVEQTKIREHYHLPAVVYRCIEYLDAKNACLEEGIYRQSGSSLALTLLRKEFNSNRDYNMLKLSKPPDIHAVASLLKAYLRELPESVLTTRLHQRFVRVVDLADRSDRIHELGHLVSELPLANYTLLRALMAHLIRIVQKVDINKMTLRNICIVFSPSLGITGNVFSLLMVEFEYIFWVNDSGAPEPRSLLTAASTGRASDVSAQNAIYDTDREQKSHQLDKHLSISVPAGINRMSSDDNIHSANSLAGTDTASFSSDFPPHPVRVFEDNTPASSLRSLVSHPETSGSDLRVQNSVRDMAAASNSTWDSQPDSDFSSRADTQRDVPRYPGMMPPPHSAGRAYRQQQTHMQFDQKQVAGLKQVGRSNRNSMQYNVGAPREMIFQETAIAVPSKITESEDDDDENSTNGDSIARLS